MNQGIIIYEQYKNGLRVAQFMVVVQIRSSFKQNYDKNYFMN